MTVGELKITLSAETGEFEKGMDLAKQALTNMEAESMSASDSIKRVESEIASIMEGILESVPDTMGKIITSFSGYVPQMTEVGMSLGDGIASGILARVSKVDIAAVSLQGVSASGSAQNTYNNTYNTTYNAKSEVSSGVNLADFENRIRRAYA